MAIARKVTSASGFTLIEAMISMFFIAFMVGEMAMVSNYARRSTGQARRITEANTLAEGVLEQSRNNAYRNLDSPFSSLNSPQNPIKFDLTRDGIVESYNETCATAGTVTTCTCTPDPTPGIAGDEYTITRTVSSYLPSDTVSFDDSTAVVIDVLVTWAGHAGLPHQIRVSTVRTLF